ncbi:MAG TPA: hypothetical protein VGD37_18245 [Kofleriaceae bacterium]|jgi:hypothetical protein
MAARSAGAQVVLPALPEIHAVNASFQLGTTAPAYSTSPATSLTKFDLWGWGVETEFALPVANDSRWATLAVSYNQLSLDADIYKGRRLRGTLRDLPALSLYVGRSTQPWYVGITIAQSELVNGRLSNKPLAGATDAGPIKIAASSFSAGVAIGYQVGPAFIELGYVARYFPSLQYDGIPTTGFPADLGDHMYAGGVMFRVGGRLSLHKNEPAKRKIPCADTTTEVKVPTELDLDHECNNGVLNLRLHKK